MPGNGLLSYCKRPTQNSRHIFLACFQKVTLKKVPFFLRRIEQSWEMYNVTSPLRRQRASNIIDLRQVAHFDVRLLKCATRRWYFICHSDALAVHRTAFWKTTPASRPKTRPIGKPKSPTIEERVETSTRRHTSGSSVDFVFKTVWSHSSSTAFKSARSGTALQYKSTEQTGYGAGTS